MNLLKSAEMPGHAIGARVECELAEPIPIILTVGAADECRARSLPCRFI
jgi:hypothetical protein